MIVNVNPYDTGFEENTHVMKFAAVAREVSTAKQYIAPLTPIPRRPMTPVAAESRPLSPDFDLTIEGELRQCCNYYVSSEDGS